VSYWDQQGKNATLKLKAHVNVCSQILTASGHIFIMKTLSQQTMQAKNIFDDLTACFTAYSRDAPIPNLF